MPQEYLSVPAAKCRFLRILWRVVFLLFFPALFVRCLCLSFSFFLLFSVSLSLSPSLYGTWIHYFVFLLSFFHSYSSLPCLSQLLNSPCSSELLQWVSIHLYCFHSNLRLLVFLCSFADAKIVNSLLVLVLTFLSYLNSWRTNTIGKICQVFQPASNLWFEVGSGDFSPSNRFFPLAFDLNVLNLFFLFCFWKYLCRFLCLLFQSPPNLSNWSPKMLNFWKQKVWIWCE